MLKLTKGDNTMQELLSPKEVAEMLSVTTETVRRWCRSGTIRARKVGEKLIRIERASVEQFITHSNLPKSEEVL